MQQVITQEQARQVCGGKGGQPRAPLLPHEWNDARNALEKCLTFEEAKYWDNWADAKAAWAKMFHDDKLIRLARQFKNRCYRQLGAIGIDRVGTGSKGKPGARSFLIQSGMKPSEADAAIKIAKLPKDVFEERNSQPFIPSPLRLMVTSREGTRAYLLAVCGSNSLTGIRSFCRANDPKELATSMRPDEARKIREHYLVEINDWLDEFEQYLPKTIEGKT